MAKFTQWVQQPKNRKWLFIGLAAIGFVVLLLLMRGGSRAASGGGTTVVQSGPSEALQAAQLQAQTEMAGIQAGVSAAALQSQAQIEMAKIDAATQAAGIGASLQALQIQQMGADRQSEREYQAAIADISARQALQTESLRVQESTTIATLQANTAQLAISTQGAIEQQRLYTEALVGLQTAQIYSQRDVDLAAINSQTTIAQGQQQLQQYALTKAKRKHIPAILVGDSPQLGTKTNAILGGVLSLGGLLSDIRAKKQIRQIGERSDGFPLYSFEYMGGEGMNAGVMAQELALMAPEFVLSTNRGFFVDYYAMDAAA